MNVKSVDVGLDSLIYLYIELEKISDCETFRNINFALPGPTRDNELRRLKPVLTLLTKCAMWKD